MRYAFAILISSVVGLAGCTKSDPFERPVEYASNVCPHCGAALARVGDQRDDREQPSKNMAVWNRSICGNPFYSGDSKICTGCWLAYNKGLCVKGHEYWERICESPDSFHRPLGKAIRECPLPGAFYTQEIKGSEVSESATCWCENSPELLLSLRRYAQEHDLSIRVEEGRLQGQAFVVVETKSGG